MFRSFIPLILPALLGACAPEAPKSCIGHPAGAFSGKLSAILSPDAPGGRAYVLGERTGQFIIFDVEPKLIMDHPLLFETIIANGNASMQWTGVNVESHDANTEPIETLAGAMLQLTGENGAFDCMPVGFPTPMSQ